MGIFDSIKNAFSGGEEDKDVTTAPSQLLREAGIDPGGLKFAFGTGTITVSGTIDDAELTAVEREALPGPGACGGQFTANTMALAMTALGLSPMGLNDIPAVHPDKPGAVFDAGRRAVELVREGVSARRMISAESLRNAATTRATSST